MNSYYVFELRHHSNKLGLVLKHLICYSHQILFNFERIYFLSNPVSLIFGSLISFLFIKVSLLKDIFHLFKIEYVLIELMRRMVFQISPLFIFKSMLAFNNVFCSIYTHFPNDCCVFGLLGAVRTHRWLIQWYYYLYSIVWV